MHLAVKTGKTTIKEDIIHFNQKAFYFLFLVWVKILFWTDIVNHKINGKLDKPVVIIANHRSGWDPFLLLSALKRKNFFTGLPYRFPAYYTFFQNPFYRAFFNALGVYPIKPKGNLDDSLADTIDHLKKGYNLIFFPEGKRVANGKYSDAKKGIGYLAKNASFYILPAYIDYDKYGENGFETSIGSKAKVVFGDLVKSEFFADKYDDNERHLAIMDIVWNLKRVDEFKKILTSEKESLLLSNKLKKILQKYLPSHSPNYFIKRKNQSIYATRIKTLTDSTLKRSHA